MKYKKKKTKLKLRVNMVINTILISLLFFGSIFLFVFSLNIEYDYSKTIISYNEKGNVKYKVNLNNNPYYTEKSLDMNQQYPSNLINNIVLDFNFNFESTKEIEYKYSYYTVSTIVINNKNTTINNNPLLLKKDTYLEKVNTSEELKGKSISINKTYNINYQDYKKFVNNYKNTYGLNVDAYLKVTMYVIVDGKYQDNSWSDKDPIDITIPLVDNAISINTNNLNGSNEISENDVTYINSTFFLVLSIIMFVTSILLFIQEFRKVLITDKVQYKYIKQLNRIIEANKDVIVKVKNKISLRGISVIEVDSIEKLLAVQNELRIPIAYFEEIENKKSSFTIVNEKTAWQYKLEVKEDK